MNEKPVLLELTRNQAIVLFDWLSRLEDTPVPVEDAEERVFWAIEGQLEKKLVEPLKPDYLSRLELARQLVVDGN